MYNFQYMEVVFPNMGIISSHLIKELEFFGRTTFIYGKLHICMCVCVCIYIYIYI